MQLYPAIDLLGGRCVRLRKGRLEDVTVYDPDPPGRAESFAEAGARWIHVVDLDAALDTGRDNRAVVAAIVERLDGRAAVQTGGGLRDVAAIESALDAGCARVVLGTAATEQPELVAAMAQRYPGQIAAAVDAIDGEVAVHGWTRGSGHTVEGFAATLAEAGVAALLATEVSRDGMLSGPDLDGIRRLLAAVDVDVLASGGVAGLGDLRALAALEVCGRTVAGAVVGKAIYEGRFEVADAVGAIAEVRR
ncbi:MAG: 1-(5-phosphoribosyl)-5-[(5-phosphoribosylamino)methylideneamino] imidazole-4-carboxamide isomerase [Acidimicrobiia bacterium]